MNKLIFGTLFSVALVGTSANAQQQASGTAATTTTIGGVATSTVALTAVGLGLAGAIASNSSGTPLAAEPIGCGAGEVEIDGQCAPSTTVTTTITPPVTTTVTTTVAPPVTVTVTTTL